MQSARGPELHYLDVQELGPYRPRKQYPLVRLGRQAVFDCVRRAIYKLVPDSIQTDGRVPLEALVRDFNLDEGEAGVAFRTTNDVEALDARLHGLSRMSWGDRRLVDVRTSICEVVNEDGASRVATADGRWFNLGDAPFARVDSTGTRQLLVAPLPPTQDEWMKGFPHQDELVFTQAVSQLTGEEFDAFLRRTRGSFDTLSVRSGNPRAYVDAGVLERHLDDRNRGRSGDPAHQFRFTPMLGGHEQGVPLTWWLDSSKSNRFHRPFVCKAIHRGIGGSEPI